MTVSFNLQIALGNEVYAKKCYEKYCNGEMTINEEDLQALQEKYEGKMEGWKAEAENDTNDYDIADDEQGNGVVEEQSSDVFGVVSVVGNMAGAIFGAIAECYIALANALSYLFRGPNWAEHEELMNLEAVMLDKNEAVENAEDDAETAADKVESVVDETTAEQEKIQAEIKAKQEELDKLEAEKQELEGKMDSEEGLTDEEKARLEELGGQIEALHGEIEELNTQLKNITEDGTDKAENERKYFQNAEEITEEAKEAAELAATFDEVTQHNAKNEAIIQGINAATGAYAATVALATPFGQVAAIHGFAGAAISLGGTIQEIKIATDVAEEIEVRTELQSLVDGVDNNIDSELDELDISVDEINDVDEPERSPEPEPTPEAELEVDTDPDGDGKKKDNQD